MRISDWSSDVCSSDLYLLGTGVPAPYRDHDKPPEAKYADLLEFLKEFQLRMPPWAKVRPTDFRKLLETVRERPDAALLESVVLRSQSLAVYAPENIGHFGLALEAYAHFTSRSEEHTSELQSLMRISSAVFFFLNI